MNKENAVISYLIERNVIPTINFFQIEEKHLKEYVNSYHTIFGNTEKACGRKSNIKFARRIAGRNLLKLNFNRGATFKDIKAGLIYLIENESFPGFVKIGMTINIKTRLDIYQTYDPFRRFKVRKYDFVLNRFEVEKNLLNHPNIFTENGEWVKDANVNEIFLKMVADLG